MALDSYTNLKSAITNWLQRGNELDTFIDDFIDVCEARLRRDLRLREMRELAELTLAEGARTLSLPSDYLSAIQLRIRDPQTTSGGRRYLPDLTEIDDEELTIRSTNTKRQPQRFLIAQEIEFDAPADREYTAELRYYQDFTPLSETNPSNAILIYAPDVYLWGSLVGSAPVLQHDERLPLWQSLYDDARDSVNIAQTLSRHGRRKARVRGVTP